MPELTALTKTIQKQFISAVDTANADAVHTMLQNPAVKAAMPGDLGQHAVKNLDRWVPTLTAQYKHELGFPASAQDAASDKASLTRFQAIIAELRDSGATLTDKLTAWLKDGF